MKQEVHRQEIEYFLRKMQRPQKHLEHFQILTGGISGATTYLLRMMDEELVCKVVRAKSERSILERARRELFFYQVLAPRLPVRVPQVIASIRDTQGIALLLTAYQPSPTPPQWQKFHYEEVARQLGELHSTFWENTDQLATYTWLRRHEENTSLSQMQQAAATWQRMQEDSRFDLLMPEHRYQRVVRLLSLMPQMENQIAGFPLTLCHGDCHSDNVLRDGQGRLIWADWQEVGVGLGLLDMSFFVQRAFFAGGIVPDEDMLTIYHQHLVAHLKQALPLEMLQRVMDSIEIRGWVFHWPAYLRQASPERFARILDRIDLLSNRLRLD